jgi:sugar lactone lactonase YvrE
MNFIEVIILCCFLTVISMERSQCPTWYRHGITIIGTNQPGSTAEELNYPEGIFIHKRTNTLYVADSKNQRIQTRLLSDFAFNPPATIISTKTISLRIYVDGDDDEPTVYVVSENPNCVEKWIQGTSSVILIGNNCSIAGVSVDKEKNVYMADVFRHCVYKWSPKTKTTEVVAGQENMAGSSNEYLQFPTNVYVDQSGSVYVADSGNNRISKWPKGAQNGIIVAGSISGDAGNDSTKLFFPTGMVVDDETGIVYVADTYNNRIQKWLPNALEGINIIGSLSMYIISANLHFRAK